MVTRLQGGAQGTTDYKHSRHVRIQLQYFQFQLCKTTPDTTPMHRVIFVSESEAVPDISWLVTADCRLQLPACSSPGTAGLFCSPVRPVRNLRSTSSLLHGFCQAADSTLWRRESQSTNKQGLPVRNWHRSLCSGVRIIHDITIYQPILFLLCNYDYTIINKIFS